MIESFADKTTEDIFNGVDTKQARKIPSKLHEKVQTQLDSINSAKVVKDLKIPAGNNLRPMKGERSEEWHIDVNDQYRIYFKFINGNAHDVRVGDDH